MKFASKFFLPALLASLLVVLGVWGWGRWNAPEEDDFALEFTPPLLRPVVNGGAPPLPEIGEAPEFPKGLDWINTKPLTKHELKGKIVLLDFWCQCCINCMHILPELKHLEKEFPNELVVIGVHSAKFDIEKSTPSIRDAVLRYEIAHAVVNDAEHQVWDNFGVTSWPTIVLMSPEGKVLGSNAGEFTAGSISPLIRKVIGYYRGQKLLDEKPLALDLEASKETATPLRFPGKILADEAGGRLFISDSGHNRIVITGLDGKLIDVIGSGAFGSANGDFSKATFKHPQGCALLGDLLYIADTENHLLRKADLKTKKVTTIAGTGSQARKATTRRSKLLRDMPLNSPWDLWIHKKDLYIAMAGPHQIWKMPLSEAEIGPFAGNSAEDIVDGRLLPGRPYEAGYSAFAQPSGLTSDGQLLYVADSEGSSIRAVPFDATKEVTTLVGTSDLPQGRLFTFGATDGPPEKARFQHCLGVSYLDGNIYVADTFNSKIRVVDAQKGNVKTLAGTEKKGREDSPGSFNEPGGLAAVKGRVFVADTNNHLIRSVDIATGKVSTLQIAGLEPPQAEKKPSFKDAVQEELKLTAVKPVNGAVHLQVTLKLPEGWKMNPDVTMNYYLDSAKPSGSIDRAALGQKHLTAPQAEFEFSLPVGEEGEDLITVSLPYYYCEKKEKDAQCKIGSVVFTVPLKIAEDGADGPVKLVHEIRD